MKLVNKIPLCYNQSRKVPKKCVKGSGLMLLPADFFWRIFEATGSITAYILYKRLNNRRMLAH